MIKCISCPLKYIDLRGNQKCLIDKTIVNAYGCHRVLSKVLKDRDIDIPEILQETQDYKNYIKEKINGIK